LIESLALAVTRVTTMQGSRQLTNATGFFFERDARLPFDEPEAPQEDNGARK